MRSRPVPRYFEFAPTDRAIAVLHDEAPFTSQLGAEFDASLEHERLRRALDLLARRHPILTSTVDRAVPDAGWIPDTTCPELLEVIDDPGVGFVSATAGAALASHELDLRTGPTCTLAHLHDAARSRSRLVFGVHHAVMDGRAMLMLFDDLRAIYVALQRGEVPVVDVDWSPRTLGALLDAHPDRLDQRARRTWQVAQRWATAPRSTHGDPPGHEPSNGATNGLDLAFPIPDRLLGVVEDAARTQRWSLNHVALTLLARAWSRLFGREAVEPSVSGWLVTVDCRRQFGAERGAGNLSGLELVSLIDVESRDLFDAIERTRAAFATLGQAGAGLAAEIAAPPPGLRRAVSEGTIRDAFALRTDTYRSSRLYSHTARLPASLARWGDATVTGLRWMPVRGIAPPYVAVVLVRFGGVSTLTFGAPETFPPAHATALGTEVQHGFEELAARL